MSTFNCGLDNEFVEALNKEYAEGGWWSRFVHDKDVFLAIRENYVNIYRCGCSLLKLNWNSGTIVGEIHYKYLLRPYRSNPYVKVVDGKAALDGTKSWFLNDMSDIDNLKKAAKPYAKGEKAGVQDILDANSNILDVEIAFGSRSRLDFAALRDSSEGVKIVFYEAKRFDNTGPEVVRQIESYSRKLEENEGAIIESYCRVCRNLLSLDGVAKRYQNHHKMLEGIANGSRTPLIDKDPVLIVFGFDDY